MIRFSRWIAVSLMVGAIQSASAAVIVLGAGPESACYKASKAGLPSRHGLASCDEALKFEALSMRDRAATHVNRSVMLLLLHRVEEALADTDAALAIDPDLDEATVNRSAALIRLGRFSEARAILNEVLPRASGRSQISGLFNRAIASEAMGDVKSAYRDLKQSLALDPEFEDAKIEIARYTVVSR